MSVGELIPTHGRDIQAGLQIHIAGRHIAGGIRQRIKGHSIPLPGIGPDTGQCGGIVDRLAGVLAVGFGPVGTDVIDQQAGIANHHVSSLQSNGLLADIARPAFSHSSGIVGRFRAKSAVFSIGAASAQVGIGQGLEGHGELPHRAVGKHQRSGHQGLGALCHRGQLCLVPVNHRFPICRLFRRLGQL